MAARPFFVPGHLRQYAYTTLPSLYAPLMPNGENNG
jgi:hypothetical protein